MVKASELTSEQLVQQIEKYERIVKGLHREREKRVESGASAEELMTARDKTLVKGEQSQSSNTATFTVEISEEEMKQASELETTSPGGSSEEDQEDLMRVTRLLKLSSRDLEELNKEKHEARARDRAEAAKSRRKKS